MVMNFHNRWCLFVEQEVNLFSVFMRLGRTKITKTLFYAESTGDKRTYGMVDCYFVWKAKNKRMAVIS